MAIGEKASLTVEVSTVQTLQSVLKLLLITMKFYILAI